MPYFEFLIAVKKKDIEAIDQMIDYDVFTSIVNLDGERSNLDRPSLLERIEAKVKMTDHWDFDIIYKSNVRDRIIAFIEVSRELTDTNKKKEKLAWLLTFHKSGEAYKLIRLYAEELEF